MGENTALKGRNRPTLEIDGLCDFLRTRHPTDTAKLVHRETGIEYETIRNWLRGRNGLNLSHLPPLLEAYGPSVLAACLTYAPAWLDDAVMAEQLREAEERSRRLRNRIEARRHGGMHATSGREG